MSLQSVDAIPIQPVYSQTEPNGEIRFPSAEVEWTVGHVTTRRTVQVWLQFLPELRLCLETLVDAMPTPQRLATSLTTNTEPPVAIRFHERDPRSSRWMSTSSHGDWDVYVSSKSLVTTTPPTSRIRRLLLHLTNFPRYFGPQDLILQTATGWRRIGTVCLVAEGWSVVISETENSEPLTKALSRSGGFAITHVCEVQRTDSSDFTETQAGVLLEELHQFLSFSLGCDAGILCPTGFDESGDRVFEQLGITRAAAGKWRGSWSWFDCMHSDLLVDVFPGFLRSARKEAWSRDFRECLYFYLAANKGGLGSGIDVGVILAFAAFERLHSALNVQIVEMRRGRPKAKKDRGPDGSKIRHIAESLGVPIVVPDNLSVLSAICATERISPEAAITQVRNGLTHPKMDRPRVDGEVYDAWRFSMYLLDLFLLRFCGHNGKFANRLKERWAGTVERVPWASHENESANPDAE